MTRTWIPSLLLAAVASAPGVSSAVSFDWALVANAGNAPDPQTGFGAVSYNYAISKHEVTNAQYAEFLNAVDPTGANALALYNASMADNFGGIQLQAANAIGDKFAIKPGREQNPVTYVSFFDAMRFTNWLHNGQGAGSTETGAYTIGSGLDEVRSTSAKFWIPSEDEWYKAAYHDATVGTAGVYFDYATGSDSVPVSDRPGDNPAAVNYFNNDGVPNGFNDGLAVSGSTSFPSANPFTDVGAYSAAASPYGTFDQNGNVSEWNEAVISSSFRGSRSGSWVNDSTFLRADFRGSFFPTFEFHIVGFRVATVPALPGDYNGDGKVDAADYTVWRDTLGQTGAGLAADGDGDLGVDPDDWTVWMGNFGEPSLSTLITANVPEPVSVLMAALASMGCLVRRRG